jgi:trigger factor
MLPHDMEKTTTDYGVTTKKLPDSRLEIHASVPSDRFDGYRSDAIKNIGKEVELPGFRKGHVPEKILSSRIGEAAILEEMAELAISRAYAEIIVTEKIDALGRPEVRITKIASGNPLEFTVVTDVFPTVKLPDYKKIASKNAKKKEKVEVSDDDVERTIVEVRRMRARSLPRTKEKNWTRRRPFPNSMTSS